MQVNPYKALVVKEEKRALPKPNVYLLLILAFATAAAAFLAWYQPKNAPTPPPERIQGPPAEPGPDANITIG